MLDTHHAPYAARVSSRAIADAVMSMVLGHVRIEGDRSRARRDDDRLHDIRAQCLSALHAHLDRTRAASIEHAADESGPDAIAAGLLAQVREVADHCRSTHPAASRQEFSCAGCFDGLRRDLARLHNTLAGSHKNPAHHSSDQQ